MTELGETLPVVPQDALKGGETIGRAQTVFILDGGAQYGMDIEQQLKRQGFYAERVPFEAPYEDLQGAGAIILSGGPESVYDPASPRCDDRIFTAEDRPPLLGICYGEQLINHRFGGVVEKLDTREDGFMEITVDRGQVLFDDLDRNQYVLMSHGDTVVEPAPGFEIIARSGDLIAGIANIREKIYGLQFHPEVSEDGPVMLKNFLEQVAGLNPEYTYTIEEFVDSAVAEVRQQVGDRQVLAFVSGGVDSSALAALLERALPSEQLSLVYVDHGFMRQGETQQVSDMLGEAGINLRVLDASEKFVSGTTVIDGVETPPLFRVTEPEMKRKIIGDTFIDVKDDMGRILGLDEDSFMLAMGTLHTDLIESGSELASGKASVIKSHHNDTEAVRKLRAAGRVLEPWRNIQKSDVRRVATVLGLSDEIANRQPYPGPGLAIRVLCAEQPNITEKFLDVAEKLQAFATDSVQVALLPIQTVGVQGDHRTYGHAAVLSGERDWKQLQQLAKNIPGKIHDINRVAYLFGEPISGALDEITPTFLLPETIEELRRVDATVNRKLAKFGLNRTLSQVPVIATPVNFGEPGKRSIALRTFITEDFKTGRAALPGQDYPEWMLDEIVDEILGQPNIARVMYDLTSKPPGTTEWE